MILKALGLLFDNFMTRNFKDPAMIDENEIISPNEQLFKEILAERVRQDNEWAPQSMPSVLNVGTDIRHSRYLIPDEDSAKFNRERAFQNGIGTWAHIFIEEVCEAVAAKNEADRRMELVQCAAIIFAWISDIDNKTGGV